MVDLLKDWNPNRYMVDVEDDTTPSEQNKEEITEVITEKDEDFEAIIKVKDLWAKYMISAFDKITSLDFNFTSKELICISLTVICITIIYLLIGCLTK